MAREASKRIWIMATMAVAGIAGLLVGSNAAVIASVAAAVLAFTVAFDEERALVPVRATRRRTNLPRD